MPRELLSYLRRHHLALVALFVALGGTSYAAVKLPDNSVGTVQLMNHVVTPIKLARSSVNLIETQRGERGLQSAVDQSARGYAHVNRDGTVDMAHSSDGITNNNVVQLAAGGGGEYCFRSLSFRPHAALATLGPDQSFTGGPLEIVTEMPPTGSGADACPAKSKVKVEIFNPGDNVYAGEFWIVFY